DNAPVALYRAEVARQAAFVPKRFDGLGDLGIMTATARGAGVEMQILLMNVGHHGSSALKASPQPVSFMLLSSWLSLVRAAVGTSAFLAPAAAGWKPKARTSGVRGGVVGGGVWAPHEHRAAPASSGDPNAFQGRQCTGYRSSRGRVHLPRCRCGPCTSRRFRG